MTQTGAGPTSNPGSFVAAGRARRARRACLLATATLALGCGGNGGGAGDALGTAAHRIAVTVCPKAWSCCMASQLMGNKLAGTDEPSCETSTETELTKQFDSIRASQDRGRVSFDADKLDACLATVRAETCANLNTTGHLAGVPGCDSFVIAKVPLGGACGFDWECSDGWCERPTEMSVGDGMCSPRRSAGVSCAPAQCQRGLVCGGAEGAKTCYALASEGATCSGDADCMSGNCPAATGGAARACAAARSDKCFYGSACAYAGPLRAGLPGTLAAAALAAAAIAARASRRRRSTRARPLMTTAR